jgi:hypothetical protein
MARIHVTPAENRWNVRKNGGIISWHRKKKRALSKAKSIAESGDRLVVHGSGGTVQQNRRVR